MVGVLVFILSMALAISLGVFVNQWFFLFYLGCFVPIIANLVV